MMTIETEPTTNAGELLTFFKALADPNRLRIVGLLAQESRTVEDLAAALDLSNGTTSHHLTRLASAGLVEARPDGHYRYYSLRDDHLNSLAGRLLGKDALPGLAADVDLDAFDRKVLATFLGADGRITAFPVQQKKYLVLLRHVVGALEPGVRYTERALNEILKRFNDDTATLRRTLVEFGFMEREGGGGEYWLSARQPQPR
ncbi:MAG: metalloregulator ArsR/SmtB family transcription factor [Trueperaceae bacterium]|nr:metalloregulator ArsR/SmtB family transcription factor [Trueperaceae bacterium]